MGVEIVRRLISLALIAPLVAGCASSSASTSRLLGLVTSLSTDQVTFQDAQLLTGGAAEEAARARGRDAVGDVFIQDLNTTETLPVDPNSSVTVIAYDPTGRPSPVPYDVARLSAVIGNGGAAQAAGLYPGDYFWLTVKDGRVVAFEKQKLP